MADMKVIFIEIENHRDLLVAFLVRPVGYMNCYLIEELQYGRDRIDDIEESDQFIEVDVKEVGELVDSYDFNNRYKHRVVKAWIHK